MLPPEQRLIGMILGFLVGLHLFDEVVDLLIYILIKIFGK